VALNGGKPYIDKGNIRYFSVEQDKEEFVWHRDDEDRLIEVIEGQGWQLQMENSLPFLLEQNKKVYINKNVYHRLIKGYDDLTIKITKV